MDNDVFNLKRTDYAVDFLLYSYFGITMKSENDKIMEAIISRAYRDAASHVLSIKDDEVKHIKRKNATDKINEYIDKLAKATIDVEKFDEDWHKELCEGLCSIYRDCEFNKDKFNNEKKFTCGIAQKWVNMTIKYIYLLYYLFDVARGEEVLEKKKQFAQDYGKIMNYKNMFHVPLDSYMYKAIKNELGIAPPQKAWSKIDNYDDDYSKCQENIRKHIKEQDSEIDPIDWENPEWIAQAIKEKK